MEHGDALAAARTVADVAGAHGDESEQGRRLAAPVVGAIKGSGLQRLISPTALGGYAAHPLTVMAVVETVAYADASAAWCAGISMGSNFLSALIPESAATEVFTDLDGGGAGPFVPGGRAEVTPDGYKVTGRWPFASNCQQAAVVAGGMIAFDGDRPSELRPDGMPVVRLGFFTADQLEIDETWNMVGMRGTGSHDVVTTDAVLPRERSCTLFDSMWPDDALFRLRPFDALGPTLAAVPLGIGRAALDVVSTKAVADAAGPPSFGPRPRLADDPIAQVDFGRAEVRLRAARALLLEALEASYARALVGDTPSRAATAMIGLACCEALRAAADAVDTAIRLLGTASVRTGGPLDRLRRDVDTAGAHVMFSSTVMAGLSRELSGIPTFAFPYLPPPAT